MYKLYNGDCLEIMPKLEMVDAIITDLPYGTTACKWDTIIPFDDMWREVKRVLKPRGAFITTASQPFTSALVMSNIKNFRDELIWDKVKPSGFQIAKYKPMKQHENIIIFYGSTYNPVMTNRKTIKKSTAYTKSASNPVVQLDLKQREYTQRYPKSILVSSNANQRGKTHSTQKPVALYEYLIKTYTNEGETVLDICMGSGTTGVACINTGRKFIGIEKDKKYFEIAERRIKQVTEQPQQDSLWEQT